MTKLMLNQVGQQRSALWMSLGAVLTTMMLGVSTAYAQAPQTPDPALPVKPDAQATTTTPDAGNAEQTELPGTVDPQMAAMQAAAAADAKYSELAWKGNIVHYPPPSMTLTGDGSFRQSLAEKGFGFAGFFLGQGGYNLSRSAANEGPDGSQEFFGQKATGLSSLSLWLTYDMSRYGAENGQIVLGGNFIRTNWEPAGPSSGGLEHLTYYQTFMDKKVEMKVGLLSNAYEYYGIYVAGNIASSIFGSSAVGPASVGMSEPQVPRPAVNFRINFGNFYDKFGAQRSTSPDGYSQEQDENPSRLRTHVENAGNFYINEFGYERAASPTEKQLWLRTGYIRNTSNFVDFEKGGRSNDNHAFYLLGDGQLWQASNLLAFRGLYGGFTVHKGDETYSAFTDSYEFRLYGIGLFPSRPLDMMALVATRNEFSEPLIRATRNAGLDANSDSTTLTLSYTGMVARGVTAGIGLAYTDKPTFIYTPDTGHALNVVANVILFF
jgi:porin